MKIKAFLAKNKKVSFPTTVERNFELYLQNLDRKRKFIPQILLIEILIVFFFFSFKLYFYRVSYYGRFEEIIIKQSVNYL